MELNTNDIILAQNKLLTLIVDELSKKLSKLTQQLKENHKAPKQRQITYYELCSCDYPIGFYPPIDKGVNYVNIQHMNGQYHNNKFQRRNN